MNAHDSEPARVLVINCGSSSIKYQLLAMPQGLLLAGGLLERIGQADSALWHRVRDRDGELQEDRQSVAAADHYEALRRINEAMHASGALREGRAPTAIGHRVVHGGESFYAPTLIDSAVIGSIRALSSLAPLHNPANLIGIMVCRETFPDVPQVAVFDTAFHQTMPPWAYRYAVPEDWYVRHGVRRYGFHGTSHRYVATRAADHLNRPLAELNLITLHLGNGASVAAVKNGCCLDTSMGFTPLEGLVMGTRCGDLDPAVPLYMQRVSATDAEGIDRALNQEAGLQGLCGTNDLREVLARKKDRDERARLAFAVYCYRIKKYIGAYTAALGRVDALVFTGGVGENAAEVRNQVCGELGSLGIALDEAANFASFQDECSEIGASGSPVRVLVVRTNEELQIARETLALVEPDNLGQ